MVSHAAHSSIAALAKRKNKYSAEFNDHQEEEGSGENSKEPEYELVQLLNMVCIENKVGVVLIKFQTQ